MCVCVCARERERGEITPWSPWRGRRGRQVTRETRDETDGATSNKGSSADKSPPNTQGGDDKRQAGRDKEEKQLKALAMTTINLTYVRKGNREATSKGDSKRATIRS